MFICTLFKTYFGIKHIIYQFPYMKSINQKRKKWKISSTRILCKDLYEWRFNKINILLCTDSKYIMYNFFEYSKHYFDLCVMIEIAVKKLFFLLKLLFTYFFMISRISNIQFFKLVEVLLKFILDQRSQIFLFINNVVFSFFNFRRFLVIFFVFLHKCINITYFVL